MGIANCIAYRAGKVEGAALWQTGACRPCLTGAGIWESHLLISDMPICWETPDIWIWSFSMKFSIFKCGELNENIVKHYANKTSLWRRLSPGLDNCRRISPKVICLQELHLHVANPQAEKISARRAWCSFFHLPSPASLIGPITQFSVMNSLLGSVPWS